MCGFVGFCNFNNNISTNKDIITNMNDTLNKRGPDEEGYYITDHLSMRT